MDHRSQSRLNGLCGYVVDRVTHLRGDADWLAARLADPSSRADAGRAYVVFGSTSSAAINLSAVNAGTGGFVGEWMVILGTVQASFWLAAIAATALIFGAAYSLWMYKRVYFGDVTNDAVRGLTDLNAREFGLMAVLAIATLWMGVYPKPFTDVMHQSVTALLKHVAMSKLVGG
jgi:NADH:ubiquinone oxidoreductase subunit 4 (subunit M)